MNEKELLDMMTAERINMLLRQQQRPGESQEVSQIIKQAQLLLKHMAHDEWVVLNQYMDHQTNRLADDAAYLYSCGIADGIRLMKYAAKL